MNIMNYLDLAKQADPEAIGPRVDELLQTRVAVFRGFGVIEVRNRSRYDVFVPLWTKPGQDLVRNFLMRCLEEILEAAESEDPDHLLEELIDSFFYLISVTIMDPGMTTLGKLQAVLEGYLEEVSWGRKAGEAVPFELGIKFTGPLSAFLATLRNRAWQVSVQQPYFTGRQDLFNLVDAWLQIYGPYFASLHEFLAYCSAKHSVLIYRLASSY